MFIAPPPHIDFDRRWDRLLSLIDDERGWSPTERQYPETVESLCWPMPYTPLYGDVPGSLREDTLCGQVVPVEASWSSGADGAVAVPRIRSAAGWFPDLHIDGGRIGRTRDELLVPMTTVGDGALPEPCARNEVLEGGPQLIRDVDDLLARSALASLQFFGEFDGTISTAATQVSEGALACGELAQWGDLEFFEALARQELLTAAEIKRSYVWFIVRPAEDPLSHVPAPPRLDLIEDAQRWLNEPRTARQVAALPLRSLALRENAVPPAELDRSRFSVNDAWRPLDEPDLVVTPVPAPDSSDETPAPSNVHDDLNIARLFTAAVEKAMATTKLGHTSNSAERHRARHEAVAQYLLDHILQQDGELDRFLEMLGVRIENEPVLYAEWEDRESRSRFDHVIDDTSDDAYRSVVVIEDKIDAQLDSDQLDRYCSYLARHGGTATLLVLHPQRNPLTSERNRVQELHARYPGVAVRFMTWPELSCKMTTAEPSAPSAPLWRALTEYAETVGTGDLTNLPTADALTDPAVAAELRDLFLSMQNVAASVGSGRSRQLRFSFHGGNAAPWLQMALTDNKHASVGLELDLSRTPGTLLAGVRGPEDPDPRLTPAKIRVFRDGKLSAAARKRVSELAELAEAVRDDGVRFPDRLPGRTTGSAVSEDGQDALELFGAIFQAQAIKNPHRGGAPSRDTHGRNEGEGNERLGAVLVREDGGEKHSISLFVGPPNGEKWERATIWIRDGHEEREIEVVPGEPGRDYVLRVWEEARTALGW